MTDTLTTEKTTTWRTVAKTGAWAFVVWAVAMQLGSLFFDPFTTVVALLFGFGARSLRTGKRSRVIAFTVVAGLVFALNLSFGRTDLVHPESAGSFVPALFVTLAVGLALIGGLGMLLAWSPDRATLVRNAAIAVFGVGVVTALVVTSMTTSEVAQPGDATLVADNFAWATETVEVDQGGLLVENQDLGHHAFAVPDLGIDVPLPAGKARRVDLSDAAPGTYDFVCSVPGHSFMTGTLVVSG